MVLEEPELVGLLVLEQLALVPSWDLLARKEPEVPEDLNSEASVMEQPHVEQELVLDMLLEDLVLVLVLVPEELVLVPSWALPVRKESEVSEDLN